MHGRKCLVLASIFILSLSSCAKKSFLKADCDSCTEEDQEWKEFSWNDLQGSWKGSMEVVTNNKESVKKNKTEKKVEMKFFEASSFFKSKSIETCTSVPAGAIVMNGVLWERTEPTNKKEFEVFSKDEEGKVNYGRVVLEKLNGAEVCKYQRFGRVMGKNRLALPSAQFSERSSVLGRGLASEDKKNTDISLEFLRFDTLSAKKPQEFKPDGRGPASVKEQERPALLFRVFKLTSFKDGQKNEWASTEEVLYRLWRAQ